MSMDAPRAQCITSLDPSETKSHALQLQSEAQYRVHSSVWRERDRVCQAFEQSGSMRLKGRAEKLGLCCVCPVLCVEHGRVPVVSPGRCRDRMCPLCSRIRGREVRDRLKALVLKADSVRLVTLTQRSTEDELGVSLQRLFDRFAKLRRTKAWKAHVKGGVFVVETTRGSGGAAWHVHLHLLIEGSYWDQKGLAAAWSDACGEPSICDIRAVHSRMQAAAYVTKYVTKGVDGAQWSGDVLCAYANGIHRRRLYGTFGKWHKVDVTEEKEPELATCPAHRVSMSMMIQAIRRNTFDHSEVVPLLRRLGFVAERMLGDLASGERPVEVSHTAADFAAITEVGLFLANAAPLPAPRCTADVRTRPPDPMLIDIRDRWKT